MEQLREDAGVLAEYEGSKGKDALVAYNACFDGLVDTSCIVAVPSEIGHTFNVQVSSTTNMSAAANVVGDWSLHHHGEDALPRQVDSAWEALNESVMEAGCEKCEGVPEHRQV